MADDKNQCQTLWERIQYWSHREPSRNAYIFRSPTIGRTVLTRRDVQHASLVFAGRIARAGMRQGDVVCNTLQNSPERVVSDLGIMSAGGVLMDKRVFLLDTSDLKRVLNKARARLLIVDPGEKPDSGAPSAWQIIRSKCSFVGDLDPETGTVPVTWPEVASLERVMFCPRGETGVEFELLTALMNASTEEEIQPQVKPDDLVVLFPTSGSTGVPKLTMYTHSKVVGIADTFQELFNLKEGEIIFQDRPVGWIAAFHLPFLSSGSTRVMTDGRTQLPETSVRDIWMSIAEERVSLAHLVPQTVSRLLALPDLLENNKVKPLRLLVTGQPLHKSFAEAIGPLCDDMYSAYGLTECAYVTSVLCRTEEDFVDYLVGRPSPSTGVKVVDEDFNPLAAGQTGQVLARTTGQFVGYFEEDEKTRATLRPEGWICTDDLGYMDEHGQLYVFGRQSDAILRGVVIIYPHQIEPRLAEIPGVQDVLVVAVPDPELYHEICACVVLTPDSTHTAESLKEESDKVNAQNVDDLPVTPKYFLIFNSAFPTLPTGKTSRKLLREEAAKRLGLDKK